ADAPAGASPSGKAPVFGTGIRRFESCRPSQSHVLDVSLDADQSRRMRFEPQVGVGLDQQAIADRSAFAPASIVPRIGITHRRRVLMLAGMASGELARIRL